MTSTPTIRQRLRRSLSPAHFEGTVGRWGLILMGLIWTPTGLILAYLNGWGPPVVPAFAGPLVGIAAAWFARKAWRAGLL